jgi:hypothetical protein
VKIQINTPIWSTRSVGISHHWLLAAQPDEFVEIEIMYTTRKGERVYPATYRMTRKDIMSFPTRRVKGVLLHIVPIDKLLTED